MSSHACLRMFAKLNMIKAETATTVTAVSPSRPHFCTTTLMSPESISSLVQSVRILWPPSILLLNGPDNDYHSEVNRPHSQTAGPATAAEFLFPAGLKHPFFFHDHGDVAHVNFLSHNGPVSPRSSRRLHFSCSPDQTMIITPKSIGLNSQTAGPANAEFLFCRGLN